MSTVLSTPSYHVESIDGVEVQKPMPKHLHAVIQGFLIQWFGRELPRRYRILPELNILCGADRLVPDITVIEKGARYVGGDLADAAPLIVEILSPGQTVGDLFSRADRFLRAGTAFCWIIWPEKRRAWTYTSQDLTDVDDLHADLSDEFGSPFSVRLPVVEMWAALDDL